MAFFLARSGVLEIILKPLTSAVAKQWEAWLSRPRWQWPRLDSFNRLEKPDDADASGRGWEVATHRKPSRERASCLLEHLNECRVSSLARSSARNRPGFYTSECKQLSPHMTDGSEINGWIKQNDSLANAQSSKTLLRSFWFMAAADFWKELSHEPPAQRIQSNLTSVWIIPQRIWIWYRHHTRSIDKASLSSLTSSEATFL